MILVKSFTQAYRGRSHIKSAAGGGRGVGQMLTIADKGGVGLKKFQQRDFFLNKNIDREGNFFRFHHS